MRIFLSVGEPSGDLHGANLIRALRQRAPRAEFVGFGGQRLEEAGCRLLYPLCRLAVMFFLRVLANARTFLRLLGDADHYFRDHRPDAVVLIDYPGFNWNIARLAKKYHIPVFYFVPPQLWAWGGWRVKKMRRWVDHVLCSLPFEEPWYQARRVTAHYVGHPYFDELTHHRPDASFLSEQQARPGAIVALLPGSRDQEIERNLPTLIRAAVRVHAARPGVRFLVACLNPEQRDRVGRYVHGEGVVLPLEVHARRTGEIIRLAHCAVAVSGSVGLELLYHGKPAVVVYRMTRAGLLLARSLVTCRFMSLVNLLADRELFPEYPMVRCEAEAVAGHVVRWLNDVTAYRERCDQLAELRRGVVAAGATERAAHYILDVLGHREGLEAKEVA